MRGAMLVLLLVFCVPLCTGTVFTNVLVREVTYSTATIQWTQSPANTILIRYGLDASYSKTMYPLEGGAISDAVYYISGLEASTTYHYAVCAGDANAAECSTDYTFTTLAAPQPSPQQPYLPRQIADPALYTLPRVPVIDGNSYTVREDCSNLQELLVTAAALEGPLNHEIVIPATADCSHIGLVNEYHAWVLPARAASSTGEIVIRTAEFDQLPPEGSRVTPEYSAHMPVIRANSWGLGDLYSTECVVGKYWWSFLAITDGLWGLKRCVSLPDVWEDVPRTDFASVPPSTCTPDSWYYNTSATQPSRGVFYCAPNGRLYPMRMSNTDSFAAVEGAHHYRLLGLHFNVVPFPEAEYWTQAYATPGVFYVGLWRLYESAHHIIFDRCLFVGGEHPMRLRSGIYGHADYLAIVDSWFENITYWLPNIDAYGCNPCTSSAIHVTGGSFMKIINNHLDGTGITLFASDDSDRMTEDVEVLRNYFVRQERYRLGSPENIAFTNKHYQSRHLIELKRGVRWLIDGNVFDHNFLVLNQGGAVVLSTRASVNTSLALRDITVTNNHFFKVPQALVVTGHNPSANLQFQPGQRFEFSNNLVHNYSAALVAAGAPQSSKGFVVLVQMGVEDLTFTHNTLVDCEVPGYWPAVFWFSDGPSAGLAMRDNIMELRWGEGYGGIVSPGLTEGTASFDGAFPDWECNNNVFVNIAQRDAQNYPSGNYWVSSTAELMIDSSYELANDSPFREGAPVTSVSGPASDGTDVGVNHVRMRLAMGYIEDSIAVSATSTQLSVSFVAPDALTPCFLDVATDAAFTDYARTESNLSAERQLTAVNLQPNTLYHYRVWCFRGYAGQVTTEQSAPSTGPSTGPATGPAVSSGHVLSAFSFASLLALLAM